MKNIQYVESEIMGYIPLLGNNDKIQVLNFLRNLLSGKKKVNSNKKLMSLVGSISKNDLKKMNKAISEGCEKIDDNEW